MRNVCHVVPPDSVNEVSDFEMSTDDIPNLISEP